MGERPIVGEPERRLLRALFVADEAGYQSGKIPTTHEFRMKHENERGIINSMIGSFIEIRGDQYWLTLDGLYASDMAQGHAATFNELLPVLRSLYRDNPGKDWTTQDVVAQARKFPNLMINDPDVGRTLWYILPHIGSAVNGYTPTQKGDLASFHLNEPILDVAPLPLTRDVNARRLKGEPGDFVPSETWSSPQVIALDVSNLHPEVIKVTQHLATQGSYRNAITDAFIALDQAVQRKSGIQDSGDSLMNRAFNSKNPVLIVSGDSAEQDGFMFLFKGAIKAVRNQYAHKIIDPGSPAEALELLAFASVLFRVLGNAQKSGDAPR